MASRHRSMLRLALEERTVATLEGARRSEQSGRLTVREPPAGTDAVATLALVADPVAARERGLEIELSATDAAALTEDLSAALEVAREEP